MPRPTLQMARARRMGPGLPVDRTAGALAQAVVRADFLGVARAGLEAQGEALADAAVAAVVKVEASVAR